MQNSRHYKKLNAVDFDVVRLPMYKYSKGVKEKFFRDNILAFFWLCYRESRDFVPNLALEDADDEDGGKKPKDPALEAIAVPFIL